MAQDGCQRSRQHVLIPGSKKEKGGKKDLPSSKPQPLTNLFRNFVPTTTSILVAKTESYGHACLMQGLYETYSLCWGIAACNKIEILLLRQRRGGKDSGADLWLLLEFFATVCAQSLSRVWLFAAPSSIAHQVPLSMGFSRHEYWSGLPFPTPGDLPNPGIKPTSLVCLHW